MEIKHLEMFVALAEVLHFGRAAQRLGCTQPALSRGVQRLETDLDVQLFERDSRNVRLTDAGQAFLQGAIDILDRASEAC
ncbi:MAG: LysR family transcriptional regulator, partial [Myxococcota bacterium]